jgi:hypothetical protein
MMARRSKARQSTLERFPFFWWLLKKWLLPFFDLGSCSHVASSQFRARVGYGFVLPAPENGSVVPIVPKMHQNSTAEEAA